MRYRQLLHVGRCWQSYKQESNVLVYYNDYKDNHSIHRDEISYNDNWIGDNDPYHTNYAYHTDH
ncbi:hypothetical protein AAVH_43251, partial [Aphelenchoides avenae]